MHQRPIFNFVLLIALYSPRASCAEFIFYRSPSRVKLTRRFIPLEFDQLHLLLYSTSTIGQFQWNKRLVGGLPMVGDRGRSYIIKYKSYRE